MPHTPIEHHRVAPAREHGERAGEIVVVVEGAADRVLEMGAGEDHEVPHARLGDVGEEEGDLDGQPRARRALEVSVHDAAVLMPHPGPREPRGLRRVHVQMTVVHEDVRSQGIDDERHRPRVVQQLEERAIPAAERQEVQGSVLIPAFGSADPIDGGGEAFGLVR